MHCEEPCPYSPYDAVDGEHDWGYLEIAEWEAREHCKNCDDDSCIGREYKNPLIKEN